MQSIGSPGHFIIPAKQASYFTWLHVLDPTYDDMRISLPRKWLECEVRGCE